jgi:GDPmannose 4,6-dehydratase
MKKLAVVTGIGGQDAPFLIQLLLEKGYRVIGTDRRRSASIDDRFRLLGIEGKFESVSLDLLEESNINDFFKRFQPDEFYNLAAQSFVKASFEQPILTANVDAIGVLRLLEAIRIFSPKTRFYQASTSELFGLVQQIPQNELTPFYPRSPYGVSKQFAHWMVVNYRESYGLYACSGILFNHESELRGMQFVTRKITNAVARRKLGVGDILELGNLDAQRDWGYAKDYVLGMYLMLQQKQPVDYVLATGTTTSIRKFVELAMECVGITISWNGNGVNEVGIDPNSGETLVKINPKFYRPAEVDILIGDPSKAMIELGWKPNVTLKQMIQIMINHDLKTTLK